MISAACPLDIFDRIFGLSVTDNFEMYVRSSRAAGAAHQCNHLAFLDHIADLDLDGFGVGVAGNQAIAVVHFYQVAIAVALAGPGDHTTGHGNNVAAVLAGQVRLPVNGSER